MAVHFLSDPWAPHPVVSRNICQGGLFGGGGGSAPPPPPAPVLATPAPMPVPSPKDQQAAAEIQIAHEQAGFTTRKSTIIGSSDSLGG